ncbi:MAG: M81 family metallopeptidase [Acetobacteraceae bacterium]|jgi:microcystin degradation protein MlrC
MTGPRVALLGFSIECNRFAPIAFETDFRARTLLGGEIMLANARSPAPMMLGEMPGFVADMDAAGPWQPLPGLLAMAEPNGPVSQEFFDRMMVQWESDLRAAASLDGVYCVLHGAGLTVNDHDPEGTLLTMVRRVVGDEVPVVATYDLHANVSPADVELVNAFIGYRTNPHLDMRERGAEAAQTLRRLMTGTRTYLSHVRLPIVPPTVTMLTGKDAHARPYGELIDLGQLRLQEPPYTGRVLNVSVMGGFAYADTPFNGLTAVVTALDQAAADSLAREIAEAGWARRAQFRPTLTSLEDATARAKATEDPSLHPLIFADVADNPGGGGRGNTMWILEAFLAANVQNGLVGVIHDPALAADAHVHGQGSTFTAHFNRDQADEFSKPFAAEATVTGLRDRAVRGRRGIYANNTLDLGLSACLRIGGLSVVVISNRVQCADPVFFEMFGLDIGTARVVVVKSRGHFRGGFDEFFRHEDVIEVDAPGLTSPVLSRFSWRHMPRPVLPIDDFADWTPPAGTSALETPPP